MAANAVALLQPAQPLAAQVRAHVEESDDALMMLARGGDAAAFDALVRRHQAAVLRVAARYLGDSALAPDVAQATFVQLHGWLHRYEARGKFKAFVMRLAVRQCAMAARSRATVRRRDERAMVADASAAPDEVVLARERRRAVDGALATLSPKLRRVVVLRYGGDLSYEEVAAALGLPVGTVKSRLFAGLAKLRGALSEDA